MRITTVLFITMCFVFIGCSEETSQPFGLNVLGEGRYLYIATGSCYAGGVATSAGPSNMISKVDIESGNVLDVIIDYNSLNPGDSPVSIQPYDDDRLLVLIENASGRRIDLVEKDGSSFSTYLSNSTALSAVLRSFLVLPDFGLLVSKSSAIEKFNSARARVTIGANPWVNAPAGACATSTTLVSSVAAFSNGKILFTHAAATPNNKLALISAGGYTAAGDCLAGQAGPTTTALPTKAIIHSAGPTLVAYGSTTAASNVVYAYNINSATNAISGATAAWTDYSIINGASAMVEDPKTGDVLIASANSTFNTIEKFHFNSVTKTLTRATNQPLMYPSIYTRCVTDMQVLK